MQNSREKTIKMIIWLSQRKYYMDKMGYYSTESKDCDFRSCF